jgi:hypothetical protein
VKYVYNDIEHTRDAGIKEAMHTLLVGGSVPLTLPEFGDELINRRHRLMVDILRIVDSVLLPTLIFCLSVIVR